jgi:hypothetical protein
MLRRFAYPLIAVFAVVSSLVAPVFLTAAPAAASTSHPPTAHGPNWLAILGVIFFAATIVIIARLLLRSKPEKDRSRRGDPWISGALDDGTDVMDAITDPGLVRVVPPVRYGPEPEEVLTGAVVDSDDWTKAMTVPAPPIQVEPTGFAEAWIAAFERGEILDPSVWSAKMLEGVPR